MTARGMELGSMETSGPVSASGDEGRCLCRGGGHCYGERRGLEGSLLEIRVNC